MIDGKVCAFDKNIVVIENESELQIYGIDRALDLDKKRRYFPLREYQVTKILASHCDHYNPYVALFVQNSQN